MKEIPLENYGRRKAQFCSKTKFYRQNQVLQNEKPGFAAAKPSFAEKPCFSSRG